jgi:tRNA(fMet)-specific endonuclease VapC
MFLLDTNICIYTINQRPTQVIEKVKSYAPPQIKVSAITVAELEYGVSKSRNRERNRIALIRFLSGFDIVPFDDSDAEVCGIIRAGLEKQGNLIGPYDLQIAAQALSSDLILVTNNVNEFERLKGLKIENWAAPA